MEKKREKMVTFVYDDGGTERMSEEAAQELAQKIERTREYLLSKGANPKKVERACRYQIVKDEE